MQVNLNPTHLNRLGVYLDSFKSRSVSMNHDQTEYMWNRLVGQVRFCQPSVQYPRDSFFAESLLHKHPTRMYLFYCKPHQLVHPLDLNQKMNH